MKKFIFSQMCMVEVEIEIECDDLRSAKDQLECIKNDMPEVSTTAHPIDSDIPCEPFVHDDVKVTYRYDECCYEFDVMEVK